MCREISMKPQPKIKMMKQKQSALLEDIGKLENSDAKLFASLTSIVSNPLTGSYTYLRYYSDAALSKETKKLTPLADGSQVLKLMTQIFSEDTCRLFYRARLFQVEWAGSLN